MKMSKTKERKVLRVLENLKYYPASMTHEEAYAKILKIIHREPAGDTK